MKRTIIKTGLIIFLVISLTAIFWLFLAETEFSKAKKLEKNYFWKRAGEKYQRALHLNPFNARYFAAAGEFLMRQSKFHKDKIPFLRRAEKLYERSLKLNPREAEYQYNTAYCSLLIARHEDDQKYKAGINGFKKALQLDPYDFRINYFIGHNLLVLWKILNEEEKEFAIERLKYVLQAKPWYGRFVYSAIVSYTGDLGLAKKITPANLQGTEALFSFMKENNFWQYRRELTERLNFHRQKEEPEEFRMEKLLKLKRLKRIIEGGGKTIGQDGLKLVSSREWQGKSSDGHIYKDGGMFWNGTIDALISLPRGKSTVVIKARGEPAGGIYPYMVIELDGKEIGGALVNSKEWKKYLFKVDTQAGAKVLSVSYINDGRDIRKEEDRNLFVGEVKCDRENL